MKVQLTDQYGISQDTIEVTLTESSGAVMVQFAGFHDGYNLDLVTVIIEALTVDGVLRPSLQVWTDEDENPVALLPGIPT